jgi:uncharacterized protein (DUF427 family)
MAKAQILRASRFHCSGKPFGCESGVIQWHGLYLNRSLRRLQENPMKSSGPSPVITVEELPGCLVVKFHGIQVAASSHVLVLNEANYPPVYYVPREDIDEKYFARTDHTSYCPYKGDASYFSLQVPGHEGANAVWTYEQPKISVDQIKNYVAFYPDQVKFEVIKADA